MCPLTCSIKNHGGEFANIIMQRVKKTFWEDVFKHYKKVCGKCMPVTFDDFASECVHYYVNICRGKKNYFLSGNGLTVVLSQFGSCMAQTDISPTMNLRLNFIILTLIIYCMKV